MLIRQSGFERYEPERRPDLIFVIISFLIGLGVIGVIITAVLLI